MNSVLLFRKELVSQYELRHAEKHFRLEESRVRCRDCLVVGRYSVMPFYEELDRDLCLLNSRLINRPEEHRWITSFDFYKEMEQYTPKTWDDDSIYTCAHPGPFVVKGKIKSKKHKWKTHMYAPTKRDALRLAQRLKADSQIEEQGVIYRQYVPLKTLEIGAKFVSFFTLDIAETQSGDWILVEINDGQMSVPGENDLDELYGNLKTELCALRC